MKKIVFGFLAVLVSCSALLTMHTPTASAASFDPNRIIDDAVFDNQYTMNAGQIDAFLNTFPSSCISSNNGFGAPDPTGYSPTNGYSYGGTVTAGTIIAHAAAAYDINPQVLLTTLQKEQSLVSGTSGCSVLRYTGATGYGCPDGGTTYSYSGLNLYTVGGTTVTSVNGTCVNSALKVGFSQQLIRGAWLLKFGQQRAKGNIDWAIVRGSWNNSDDPQSCYGGPMTAGTFKICPSGPAVYYDGYRTIDGSSVNMTTGATASLYWYTPHFHGNQSFYNIFTGWFGSVFANDTDMPHPNGTLISDGSKIYIINGNGQRSNILNPSIFSSYNFTWGIVKKATSGDNILPIGPPMDVLAPGTIFTTNTGLVYIMDFINGSYKKQWLSYSSFQALGYQWSDVMQVDPGFDKSETAPGVYTSNRHPAGALVVADNQIFQMDSTTRRHVISPQVFSSYYFNWGAVHTATVADAAVTVGAPLDIRPGTIMYAGDIFVVDYDGSGIFKHPIGPWECYQDRFHYISNDWFDVPYSSLPLRTGSRLTC